ncbi:hypothetical protein [Maridesulfovibrio sp.]|uniref:hypothetical protein n=1 Tax=Maridesulfovibrio sp. TaxID=2795000 RepID=UPI0029F51F52|nr:hypothetical protein [Maridesulfovibrio sp.]
MQTIVRLAAFALIFILLPCDVSGNAGITIAIEQNSLKQINDLAAKLATPLDKLENVPDIEMSRSSADVIILLRALRLGGIDSPVEFISVPNARRSTEETARGRTVLCSQQLNKKTNTVPGYENAFLTTAPITRFGEFQKGFYCLPGNTALLSATSAEEINMRGRGIVGQHWNNDIQILRSIGITNLITAPTFKSMLKIIEVGRAGWIPLEIANSKNFSITMQGITLVPIPGIKFSLLESRHFLVSRKHPRGKEVYGALQKGIKKLRKQGFIRKILSQAGIFNPRTNSWKILNEDAIQRGGY